MGLWQVLGLSSIETEPGEFESDSHMLAVGVDILYIPLKPSGAFDQLSDDFNRSALVLAITMLFGVTVALSIAG
jgi:hypothetical protein